MGKQEATFVPLKYALESVLTVRYQSILPIKKFDPTKPDLVNYNVTPNASFRIQSENILVRLNVNAVLNETNEKILDIETHFAFKVPQLKSHVNHTATVDGKKRYSFKDPRNKPLIKVLVALSYSTLRGILIEKNSGTVLHNVYLPIVDPSIFILEKK